jgi:hypothetical protein
MVLTNVDLADMTALEPRLIRYSPDNVSGLHAMHVADFDAEGLVGDVSRLAFALARRALVRIAMI